MRLFLARARPYGPALAVKALVVATLLVAFLYGDYRIFRRLFAAARRIETLTPMFALGLIENFLGLVFLVASMVLFFSAMTSAISSLFLDFDLETWHAAPVSRLRIATARLGKALVQSAYLVFFFLMPVIVALQLELGKSAAFSVAGGAGVVLMLVPPVCLACTIVLLLVRFFPVRRVHQIAVTLAIVVVTGAVVGIRMVRPERLFAEIATDDVVAVLQAIRLPSAELFPAAWLANALLQGNAAAAWRMAGLAAASLLVYLAVARWTYFTAFVRAKETSAPTAIGAGPFTRLLDRLLARADPPTRALFGKEARIVTRDAAQWSQLFMMAALLFIYLYNIQMMPLEGDFRAAILAYVNLGMSGFVVAAICLRFAYPSIAAEGKQFWILETAPVSIRRILWTKAAVYALPLLVLSLLLTVLANLLLDASGTIWGWTLAGAFCSTAGLVGLGVGMGAMSADFKRENPIEVAVSLGGLAYMAISLLYVGSMMFLLARPVQRLLLRIVFGVDPEHPLWVTPLLAGVFVSALLAIVPIEIAARRFPARRRF
ncbi:MAG: putative ABC transporter permease subunit [Thermoanaerobaculia bacterium]